jgi:hypothetical protein
MYFYQLEPLLYLSVTVTLYMIKNFSPSPSFSLPGILEGAKLIKYIYLWRNTKLIDHTTREHIGVELA